MFFEKQTTECKKEYKSLLGLVGSLSNMFSDSNTPYLYYRIAEKIFCQSFNSDDLSRSDVAIDSKYLKLGIGLKTFLRNNNKTFQKVAEFNKDKNLYENLKDTEKVIKIAELRNERIEFSKKLYELNDFMYHCILRDEARFHIYEEKMSFINIDKIKNIKRNKSSIIFEDECSEYSFNLSKSTLLKRFNTNAILDSFDVRIIDNPLVELQKLFTQSNFENSKKNIIASIYLPLYGRNKKVYERSGLNQWNARGRHRDINEVYIPIPAKIHQKFPAFFPKRDTSFSLHLPNGNTMQSKVCQDGSKALMSYSNKELGQWILRDVLDLKEKELLTYEMLQAKGIDSIRLDKLDDKNFVINFCGIGSYEDFMENNY